MANKRRASDRGRRYGVQIVFDFYFGFQAMTTFKILFLVFVGSAIVVLANWKYILSIDVKSKRAGPSKYCGKETTHQSRDRDPHCRAQDYLATPQREHIVGAISGFASGAW